MLNFSRSKQDRSDEALERGTLTVVLQRIAQVLYLVVRYHTYTLSRWHTSGTIWNDFDKFVAHHLASLLADPR